MTKTIAQYDNPGLAKKRIADALALLSELQNDLGVDTAEIRVLLQDAWHGASEFEMLHAFLDDTILDVFYADKHQKGQIRYV